MREFNKPNVKASRYRPEVYSLLNKKFFDKFKNKYPKYKDMTNLELRNIIKKFHEHVYNTVIEKRDGIQLPEQIGWLFIGACESSKKRNVDYAKSNKYGVEVSYNNWNTDGRLAKIFFTSNAPKHKMKNREFWRFVGCRNFKRSVAKAFSENWNNYIIIDSSVQLRLNYQKTFLKDLTIREQQNDLKSYNEFDI
jgi:hypothetical protein